MSVSKEPAAAASATPPMELPPLPRRRGLRKLALCGLIAGLFGTALTISWQLQDSAEHETEEIHTELPEPPRLHLKKIDNTGSALKILALGDEALFYRLYKKALSQYEELLAITPDAAPIIHYRIALCNESLSHHDQAITSYRKAISSASAPAVTFASNLGMARCFLAKNLPSLARQTLYPFLFDETRTPFVPDDFFIDARLLVALSTARETLEVGHERLTDDHYLSYTAAALEMPLYLDEAGIAPRPRKKEMAREKTTPHLVVQERAEKQPAVILKMDQAAAAPELMELLALRAGLHLEWSVEAKKTVAERSLRLCLRNWFILEVLEQAADSFDLTCLVEGDAVHIATRQELNSHQAEENARARAGRALRNAALADPEHPWMAAVALELGNCEAHEGHVAEAAKSFDRIIREMPGSPYVGAAYYNLAKLYSARQDYVRARQAYFHALDHACGHELALRAQIRIGQLFLEEEDAASAVTQLRRAHLMTPGSPYHPLAALALAAAHLQNSHPELARTALAKDRAQLQKDPYRATAAFLDTYAQYRLAKGNIAGKRAASDLLSTLLRDQDESMLGVVGSYLIAQAYRDVGIWDQAERLLKQALAHCKSPLAPGLEFLLADTFLKHNQRTEAVALLEKLTAQPNRYRAQAVFLRAQLDLQDKHYQECADKCRELWTEQAVADVPSLLQVWGAALEGTGDFARAAQCFGGKAPI